jgi:DNA-binding MarR family transcriptional regulator
MSRRTVAGDHGEVTRAAGTRMTMNMRVVLGTLAAGGRLYLREIAIRAELSPGTISKITRRLAQQELLVFEVERIDEHAPRRPRRKYCELTPAGRELADRVGIAPPDPSEERVVVLRTGAAGPSSQPPIGARLAELRGSRGVTPTEMAARLRTNVARIDEIERSRRIRVKTLIAYLGALGADLEITAIFVMADSGTDGNQHE